LKNRKKGKKRSPRRIPTAPKKKEVGGSICTPVAHATAPVHYRSTHFLECLFDRDKQRQALLTLGSSCRRDGIAVSEKMSCELYKSLCQLAPHTFRFFNILRLPV
jgi:hypothetical protein